MEGKKLLDSQDGQVALSLQSSGNKRKSLVGLGGWDVFRGSEAKRSAGRYSGGEVEWKGL